MCVFVGSAQSKNPINYRTTNIESSANDLFYRLPYINDSDTFWSKNRDFLQYTRCSHKPQNISGIGKHNITLYFVFARSHRVHEL